MPSPSGLHIKTITETPSFKQIFRFLIVGSGNVATDALSYSLMIPWMPVDAAKASSFVLGALFGFVLNRQWTFQSPGHPARQLPVYAVVYFTSFCANVGVNHALLRWFPGQFTIAFLIATLVSTGMNFMGMKFLVFR